MCRTRRWRVSSSLSVYASEQSSGQARASEREEQDEREACASMQSLSHSAKSSYRHTDTSREPSTVPCRASS